MAASTAGVTGDGTAALVAFDTDLAATSPVDINAPSAYQTTNGTYTAKQSGYHTVSLHVLAGLITSAHTTMKLEIHQHGGGGQVARGTRTIAIDPNAVKVFAGYAAIGIDTEIYMDAGQTLQAWLTVFGGASKDVFIYGSGEKYSRMEARLS
jgi:hypothetical protein